MKQKLKVLFVVLSAIITGIFVAVIVMAFTGPGSNTAPTGDPVFWRISGSNVYYDGGNVGIGTASPSYKLDVTGGIRATATSTFSGNVGIGTTNPAYSLDITGGLRVSETSIFSGAVNIGGYSAYSARVVARFDSSATPVISMGYNVASVVKNTTGQYTINFTNAAADSNYVCVGSGRRSADVGSAEASTQISFSNWTTSSVKVGSQDNDTNGYQDSTAIMVVCYW